MEKLVLKRKMNLGEMIVLWLFTLIALSTFFYIFAPDRLGSINELLLQNAQDKQIYIGVFGCFFALPLLIVGVSYTLSKLILSLILKGGKKTLYVLLLTSAIITQLSYYATQYLIETML